MKVSQKKQPKSLPKFTQYRTHHDIDVEDDEELAIVGTILIVIVGLWWGLVHIIDIFFDKLSWWMEPLTIIPFLVVALPAIWVSEMYGRNPMHWWPMVWGTKVTLPDREPFHTYDEKFEKVVEEFGPTRIYVVDYNTLKFRTKKDATLYCLKNLS